MTRLLFQNILKKRRSKEITVSTGLGLCPRMTAKKLCRKDLETRLKRIQLNVRRQAVRVLDLGNEATRAVPTKVGIAQPQRRVYGSSDYPQVSVSSTSSQALRENTVASKHKRVSLGIERSTNSASKGAQQVSISCHLYGDIHRACFKGRFPLSCLKNKAVFFP